MVKKPNYDLYSPGKFYNITYKRAKFIHNFINP